MRAAPPGASSTRSGPDAPAMRWRPYWTALGLAAATFASLGCTGQVDNTPVSTGRLRAIDRQLLVSAVAADESEHGIAGVSSLTFIDSARLAVFDPTTARVSVISRTGGPLRRWGGVGDGPGEFRGRVELAGDDQGGIVAWDAAAGRVSTFDSLGHFQTSFPVRSGAILAGRNLRVLTEGRLALRVASDDPGGSEPHRRYLYRRFDRGGMELEPRQVPIEGPWGGVGPVATLPFTPHLLQALGPRGGLYLATSDEYRVFRLDAEGVVTDTLARPATPVRLRPAERENFQAFVDARLTTSARQIPEVKPILRDLWTASDGSLVVALHGEGIEARQERTVSARTGLPTIHWTEEPIYDLFTERGTFLGRLHLPPRSRILDVRFPDVAVLQMDGFDRVMVEIWRVGESGR